MNLLNWGGEIMKRKYRDDVTIVRSFITAAILVIILIAIAIEIIAYTNVNTGTITVADKYVKARSESQDIYIIVDSDDNSYEITDLLLIGKFNSSDLYSQMKIGETYNIETTGYRIQFLSRYPNINKVSPK